MPTTDTAPPHPTPPPHRIHRRRRTFVLYLANEKSPASAGVTRPAASR